MPPAGRYAPSPSGDLHFGNLRTAVLAWLLARQSGRRFVLRVEDIDSGRSSDRSAARQIEDLLALGITIDGPPLYQQQRLSAYQQAIDELSSRSLVYECYCSRADIRQAAAAPHTIPGHYPGTCRDLSPAARAAQRERLAAAGRRPALRLAAEKNHIQVRDQLAGTVTGEIDDMVLRRGGQLTEPADYAYNLAVVIDDAYQGVDQVVRGDDLLPSAGRQQYLAELLGISPVTYIHVPLVLGESGKRLAKRDGAVTLRQLTEPGTGHTVSDVIAAIAASIGASTARSLGELASSWDISLLPREPTIFRGLR